MIFTMRCSGSAWERKESCDDMGKSGDRLRAAKGEVKITMTRAELEARDRRIAQETIRQREQTLKRYVDARAEEAMKEYFTDERELDTCKVLLYALSISCKVLIEKFGWSPIRERMDNRMQIIRFCLAVEDELAEIEKFGDLKTYSHEVYKKYGVGFVRNKPKEIANGDGD